MKALDYLAALHQLLDDELNNTEETSHEQDTDQKSSTQSAKDLVTYEIERITRKLNNLKRDINEMPHGAFCARYGIDKLSN